MVNGTAVHISRICIECVISQVAPAKPPPGAPAPGLIQQADRTGSDADSGDSKTRYVEIS